MKFTIREMMLVTLVVAVMLGWLVDHWRAAARDAQWEQAFDESLRELVTFSPKDTGFDTPTGHWRIIPKHKDVSNKVIKPR